MAAPEPVEGTETPKLTTAATPEPSSALRQPVNETDRETLVAFYHATDGPDWVNNDNWLSDRPLERVVRRFYRQPRARNRVTPPEQPGGRRVTG